jgi:8-oxo-dGTP pyrophosphatase MutT (NUDIX family)
MGNARVNRGERTKIWTEHSAGGVVFRRTQNGILVGLIKDSHGKWTFAKGRIEKGETPAEAAVRETAEEMGLKKLRLISFLGRTSIWFKDRYEHVGEKVNKFITYFLMETAPEESGRPEGRERVYAIKWVLYRDLPEKIGYKNTAAVAKKAVTQIDIFYGKH